MRQFFATAKLIQHKDFKLHRRESASKLPGDTLGTYSSTANLSRLMSRYVLAYGELKTSLGACKRTGKNLAPSSD